MCSGGYVLGFRVDPPDRLKGIYREIQSLHQVGLTLLSIPLSTQLSPLLVGQPVLIEPIATLQVFSVSPIFGVDYKLDEQVGDLMASGSQH